MEIDVKLQIGLPGPADSLVNVFCGALNVWVTIKFLERPVWRINQNKLLEEPARDEHLQPTGIRTVLKPASAIF